MRTALIALCALAIGAPPLVAQESIVPVSTPVLPTFERLRLAGLLPLRADEVRRAGVHDSTVRRVLEIFRVNAVGPVLADEILATERDAARRHGPTDNFGAFVQRQLATGARGQGLAQAIWAEHRARGRGHGQNQGPQIKNDIRDSTPGQGQSGRDRRPSQGPRS